jgi:predicted DNA-binding transcriptional regulator YafY
MFPAMRESKSTKWLRLMDLIHRIAAEPGKTSQQLALEMKCAPRTIFRDLSDLQDLGFPVYNDNGYRFAADAFLPTLNLQPRELFALFLGARLLESHGKGELGPDARRALEKLSRASGQASRPDLGALRELVQVAESPEATGMDLVVQMQAVIGKGQQLRIFYLGLHDPQALPRDVDPMGLFSFRQVWYLRAYDHRRKAFRSFRLSRIHRWELLQVAVQHAAHMELQDAVYHRWDVEADQQVEVEIKVSESLARWLAENPPHPSQKLDGDRATYLVSDLAALARWAASLHGLEILSPPALRREMAKLGRDLVSLYSDCSTARSLPD